MALYDYIGALRQGRKQYQEAVSKGQYPYLPVLDDILSNTDIVSEGNLGVIDIPLDRVVGAKTHGRTQAFASNFMPLLGERSEFGAKWGFLYDHQIEEGIHDPIFAYEFMNRYYVQEGNKRVSVLKYLRAYSISASVIRLIPKRSDDRDTKLYYEFLDFYQVSFNCDVWFSREGSYKRLLEAMGKGPNEVWTEDERQYFKAAYDRFSKVFYHARTEEMELTASDAFLKYVEFFSYEVAKERTGDQMKKDLVRIWDELLLASRGSEIALVEKPEVKESSSPRLLNWLIPGTAIEPEMLKLAFIYPKGKEVSSWVYAHELGRMNLEQRFQEKMHTRAFEDIGTEEEVLKAVDQAVEEGCNVIFTVAPQMAAASVKAAIKYPKLRIFNCSVNMSYSSIRTYYARMYESKFLMGALAAAMSEREKLGYIADYPIYGMMSNINAFAMGARMINPRAKVYLKWSGLKEHHCRQELEQEGITHISGEDMITPIKASREYGLYCKAPDGTVENLATSLTNWGKFYEQIVNQICRGDQEDKSLKGKKAINYWWGMSADVIDVICSKSLPFFTQKLIDFLKWSICCGSFRTFEGKIYAQKGLVVGEEGRSLTPEEIIRMGWLCDNVVGQIPPVELFKPEAQAMIRMNGVKMEETGTEEKKGENSGAGRL